MKAILVRAYGDVNQLFYGDTPDLKPGPGEVLVGSGLAPCAAGVLRIGNAVGAAITSHRVLGPAEARIMFIVACLLLPLTVVAILWPRVVAVPIAVLGGWLAISLLVRAYRLRASRN